MSQYLEEHYQLLIGPHNFIFENEQQVRAFLTLAFNHSANRAKLYEEIAASLVDEMFREYGLPAAQANASARIVRTAKIIVSEYGKIYDPKGELLELVDTANIFD